MFVHDRSNEVSFSLLADSCNNIICVYNVSASQAIIYSQLKMFSHLPVRLLLHSTLAAAETLPFAGELLPFERRQPYFV